MLRFPSYVCMCVKRAGKQKSEMNESEKIPTWAGDLRACGFKVIGLVGVNSIPGTRSNMRS